MKRFQAALKESISTVTSVSVRMSCIYNSIYQYHPQIGGILAVIRRINLIEVERRKLTLKYCQWSCRCLIIFRCFKQWNLLIIRVMLKPLMVLMASAASCLMALFLYHLIPYKLHTLGLVQFSSHNLTGIPHAHLQHTKQNELISQLSRLTSVPLLGQFYKKEMITELVELKHWEEALSETNLAVETYLHRHSFPIWFYKALSQCMLELIPDCEKSTRHAEYLLDPQYKKSMAELYKFLQNKMKNQQSPEIEKAKRETARLNIQEL